MKDMDDLTDEIWVNEFTEESAQEFRKQLVAKSKMDPRAPIIVYIDSYGGMVDSLAMMIETMDSVPNSIITVCHGKAMSCGAILLSHGDLRFCGKHSRVMVHEVSAGTGGDVHDMNADVVELKRLNEYFLGLLAKNCGIKEGYKGLRKLIKDQDGRDRYLNAENAVKFGIVDAVGTPKIDFISTYALSLAPNKHEKTKEAPTKKPTKKTSRKSDPR